jgi:type II secretory pathway component GspD/PulD (secretin)
MSPEIVTGSVTNVPPGRQRFLKVFSLKHIQAADLKDRVRLARTDKAVVDIDERANQIIITDYNDNIRIAGELIDVLDTDKPEDVGVRIIALKNVGAIALAKEIGPLYQKLGGKTLDIAADERANSLIILSSRASYDAIKNLATSLDTEDAQEIHTSGIGLVVLRDLQPLAVLERGLVGDDPRNGHRQSFVNVHQRLPVLKNGGDELVGKVSV